MSKLNGRKIVVMGGTSGIGLAAARELASMGATVVVTGRDSERAVRVQQQNPKLKVATVDAASSEALEGFYRAQGSIDDLILSVGGAKGAGPFGELSSADLREGFAQKFFPQVEAAQRALPFLSKDGSLTFVTAISARAAIPGTSGLAAINGAIEAMVKPLARELKPLRVNAISPGVVETPWWDQLPVELRQTLLQQYAETALVGRNGFSEELGSAIAFLVTSGFVSGTVLEIDGGLRLA